MSAIFPSSLTLTLQISSNHLETALPFSPSPPHLLNLLFSLPPVILCPFQWKSDLRSSRSHPVSHNSISAQWKPRNGTGVGRRRGWEFSYLIIHCFFSQDHTQHEGLETMNGGHLVQCLKQGRFYIDGWYLSHCTSSINLWDTTTCQTKGLEPQDGFLLLHYCGSMVLKCGWRWDQEMCIASWDQFPMSKYVLLLTKSWKEEVPSFQYYPHHHLPLRDQ